MIRVIEGKVTETQLPKVGRLSDGRTVSGYDKLPEEILKAEGWLPEVKKMPLYDAEKEQLKFSHYEVLKTQINVHYTAEAIPEPEPDPVEVLQAKVLQLEKDVASLKTTKEETRLI